MREIDLRPTWYIKALAERSTASFRTSGLLVMGVLIVMWIYDATSRTRAATTEYAELTQQVQAQDAAAADIAALEKEMMDRERYAGILRQVGGGVRAVEIISELSHAMPGEMSVYRLSLEKAPRVSEANDEKRNGSAESDLAHAGHSTMDVHGFAATGSDVGSFVSRLSRSPLFGEVSLRYQRMKVRDDVEFVEFHVECLMPLFE